MIVLDASVKVISALQKPVGGQRTDSHRNEQFLAGLEALPAERYAHAPLLARICELRRNFTAYDAYVHRSGRSNRLGPLYQR